MEDDDEPIDEDYEPIDEDDQESKPENKDLEVKKTLAESIAYALEYVEKLKIRRAKRKPLQEANFQALKNRPDQFFSLSDEEKKKMSDRLEKKILRVVFPKKADEDIPPPCFRPPKHPFPPVDLLPVTEPPSDPDKPTRKRKVLEDNWFVNRKRAKREEQERKFNNDYREMVHNSKFINMKKLCHMNKSFVTRKGTQNLKEKIYAVLYEGDGIVFKNYIKESRDSIDPKRSFLEWVRNCNDLRRLKLIKIRAISVGRSITRAIMDLMFLMSQNMSNELVAKFQAFEDALAWVNRDEISIVICRILEFIKAIVKTLRRKKESETANTANTKGKEVKVEGDGDAGLEESFVDSFMHRLIKEVLQLELFWVCKRLPCCRSLLMEILPLLEDEIQGYEMDVVGLEAEVEDDMEYAKFGIVSMDWKETVEYFEMEMKMDELWSVLHHVSELELS